MKLSKLLINLLCVGIFMLAIILLGGCFVFERPKPSVIEYVTVEYLTVGTDYSNGSFSGQPSRYGSVIGESRQDIVKGESTTTVTVVPNVGYKFIKWADTGSDNPTRNDVNIQESCRFFAIMEGPIHIITNYEAGKGGTVEGTLKQDVLYGTAGEPVTAIPNEGFRFVQWSDGDTNPVRLNECVTEQYLDANGWAYLIAEFERYERNFEFVYNDATNNNTEVGVSINLDNIDNLQLPVPQRDGYSFEGWYSDWHHTVKVANEKGELVVGIEWLNNDFIYNKTNPEGFLYAKWRTNIEVPTFKILMPFVTEIHAQAETLNNGTITVDYVMSDVERDVCETITQRFADYLNAILNGKVRFIVDSYFTTKALTSKNLGRTTNTHPFTGDKLWDEYLLKNVEEITQKSNDYDAVLTTFSLNDEKNKLHISAGSAGGKNAQIHLENLTRYFYNRDNYSLTDLYDLSIDGMYIVWESVLETYLHEFTHILEHRFIIMDNVGLHASIGSVKTSNEYEVLVPFLRGEFILNGQQTGVKYEYWLEK